MDNRQRNSAQRKYFIDNLPQGSGLHIAPSRNTVGLASIAQCSSIIKATHRVTADTEHSQRRSGDTLLSAPALGDNEESNLVQFGRCGFARLALKYQVLPDLFDRRRHMGLAFGSDARLVHAHKFDLVRA